nr:hypothetical protein [Bacteroidota bacterium]
MSEKVEKNKKSKSIILLVLSIILLIALVVVGYLYFNTKSQVEVLMNEKEQVRVELQTELDALMKDHDQVKSDYGRLSDSLSVKDSIILADAKEIKQLLNYKWDYYQIKKKLDRLREVAQGYVIQLDSMYVVNEDLMEENERIRQNYRTEKNKNTELVEEKQELEQIVNNATIMRAYNIKSTGIRKRGPTERETDKARRTDRVRVCFTLGENPLLEAGRKTIYLRIARPDNVILTYDETDEYAFTYKGEKLQFSLKQSVDYKGEAQDVCLYWDKRNSDNEAMAGRYHVMVYTENEMIGESFFELR